MNVLLFNIVKWRYGKFMNNQRWLSQNFFTFFITWGIFLPYWTGWLVDAKHLTVSQASVVMGCGLLARATSNLFSSLRLLNM
ncbi:probable 3-phenylpropionic acid transporter [Bacillus sp. B14905]|nr:probable 3-phenylpropionic acid transporter [Bacillus sp. B14905]